MTTPLKHMAIVLLMLLWQADMPCASAEPSALDQKLFRLMRDEPTNGLVFLEVSFTKVGQTAPPICQSTSMRVMSDAGIATPITTQVSPTIFGKASEHSAYGGMAHLAPGTYTVDRVWCENVYSFRGEFARFTVPAAQVLNLGRLSITFDLPLSGLLFASDNKGSWVVGDLSPKAVASIAKRAPAVFSKARKQYMTAVRSAPKP